MGKVFITSESVTSGHPDKICDQISDAILDAALKQDPESRVACEVCITTGLVIVMGEITTKANFNISKVVRNTISDIGYNNLAGGFDAQTCGVLISLDEQSKDISKGVDQTLEYKTKVEKANVEKTIGAGDQGMMYGYATNETVEYMPYPVVLAHKLVKRLDDLRKRNVLAYLRPDGKSQVTVEYNNGIASRIEAVVISAQHDSNVSREILERDIRNQVIDYVLPSDMIDSRTKIFINPTGRFVVGGPQGDSGLTGRKIIVDTYGGVAHHGGGAFSGKDPTKVDRSGAYMARYIAKNIVAAGVAPKCEIQLSYAIGVANPLSIAVESFGTGIISDEQIIQIIHKVFSLTPNGIITSLNLKTPIYKQVAAYGHFGRSDLNVAWEKLDKVDEIKQLVKTVC
ncbi:methionine adenosyltransferase [Blautia pseudococcoides]|uniref:methionine adenosyltransferase n=1 Tax=Blautia pseudococcoides TaxID=1796616 RepID=UPI00148B2307|nr:methionine adenosyltransferase [Blautia pseudococcoides]QJU15956.1 methionine adenosyltransferase [Blautia pseudococcoides]